MQENLPSPELSQRGWDTYPGQPLVSINGLPTLTGKLIGRNGAVALMRRADGAYFEVHQQYAEKEKAKRVESKGTSRSKRIHREYI
jgi:hypothetical protein